MKYYIKETNIGNGKLVKVYEENFPYPITSLGMIKEDKINELFSEFLKKQEKKDINEIYFEHMLVAFEYYKQNIDGFENEPLESKYLQNSLDAFMYFIKFYGLLNFDCDSYISKYFILNEWLEWYEKENFMFFCQRYKNGVINI